MCCSWKHTPVCQDHEILSWIFEQDVLWPFLTAYWNLMRNRKIWDPLVSLCSRPKTREKLTFKCKKENSLHGPTFQNRQNKTPNLGWEGFWTCSFRKFMTRRKISSICMCAHSLDFQAKSSFTPSRHFWSHVPNTCYRNPKIYFVVGHDMVRLQWKFEQKIQ